MSDELAVIRLVGSVLAEQNRERVIFRRYFSAESLANLTTIDSHDPLHAPRLLEGLAYGAAGGSRRLKEASTPRDTKPRSVQDTASIY